MNRYEDFGPDSRSGPASTSSRELAAQGQSNRHVRERALAHRGGLGAPFWVFALAIAALLAITMSGSFGVASAQEADDDTIHLPGLAKVVENEEKPQPVDDPGQGIGGSQPPPVEATPTPKPPPQPGPTPVANPFRPSVERWRSLAHDVFPDRVVNEVLFIIQCESNGNPNATGASGEHGLMQVHPRYHQAKADQLFGTGASLYDPFVNLSVAAIISGDGSNWSAWSYCSARLP